MPLGPRLVVCAAIAVAVLGAATPVCAMSARVRWLPSADVRVTGYNVYVRAAGQPYPGPIDVGMPTPDATGALAAVVPNLVDGRTHYFSVTARTDTGMESGCSGELALGVVEPCRIDQCCRGSCAFQAAPDGVPCAGGEGCNLCWGGACVAGVEADLFTRELKLVDRSSGTRLHVIGRFAPTATLQPTQTGATFEVSDPLGTVLYTAAVPANFMRSNATRTLYYMDRRAGIPGLLRLKFRIRRGAVRVGVIVTSDALRDALSLSGLRWVLRLGTECVRAATVSCVAKPRLIVCE